MLKYDGNTIIHEQGVKLVNAIPAFHQEVDINTTDKGGMKAAKKAARETLACCGNETNVLYM